MEGLQSVNDRKMLLHIEESALSSTQLAKLYRNEIDSHLSSNGALLIRGLKLNSADEFADILKCLFEEDLVEYTYRSTPRTQLVNNVYTATEYHPSEVIPQHNENAYASSWPLRIGFLCMIPPGKMGNTPISDSRTAYKEIPLEIRKEFERKNVMYVRNYSNIDLPWSEVFQTNDKMQVEKYCREHDIVCEWTANGLRTKQIGLATMFHPVTQEKLWFNQAHLFHISSLDEEIQEGLISILGEENLPRNAYFSDGTCIPKESIAAIRKVYENTKFSFQWQQNDLLLLDNMLFTHGREPFEGDRKILVGMAKEYSLRKNPVVIA